MRRSFTLTAVFALAVVAVVTGASLFTYARVRDALETEFARRVEWVAAAGAADVPGRSLRILREEGAAAFALSDSILLSLGAVRRSSQAARVFLLDADGTLLLDTESDLRVGESAPLDSAAHAAVRRALAGQAAHGGLVAREGRRHLTAFAPVRDAIADPASGPDAPARVVSPVVGVLGVEASAEFLDVLPEIGRLLASTALVGALAVLALAALFVRLLAAQQRLERSLSRAENLASVGELAATLAHEVRNPLGVIDGAAKRLHRHYSGPEPELFGYIEDEVKRLSRTVHRYLAFARPAPPGEGGDVADAFAVTLGLLESEAGQQSVRVVRERDAAVEAGESGAVGPHVALGGEELKQVLFNLVRNALEALPAGGTIRVGWAAESRRVSLWVADDGPGMDAETLARARRPFVTTRPQGTGLGLAIVDRLVREAGGRFDLTSAPGAGTTARLELPRAENDGQGGA